MKKIISICCLLATIFFAGCTESDMNSIREDLNTLTGKVETLTSDVTLINRQIVALQTLVSAINSYDYVTSIEPITENGEEIGYTINFAKGSAVTIYNGENASAPVISVAKDSDGLYYWTVQVGSDEATWLLDQNGEKIATTGDDGTSGTAGSDGATPVISVDELDGVLYWKVDGEWLYYNGEMVPTTGSNGEDGTDGDDGADGEDGADGSAGADGAAGGNLDASTVTYTDNGATVTINFGSSSFTFDKATGSLSFLETENVTINIANNTIDVVMPTTLAEADFAALQAEVVSSNGESGAEMATRSESQLGKWGVEIATPDCDSKGKWSNAKISISKPIDLNTSTIEALLTVTLVEKDGTTSSSSVAFTYRNDDSAALVASAQDIMDIENKEAVESLVIDGSATDIEAILTAISENLPNLTYLDLSDCSNVAVPANCFANNTILEEVILPAGSTIEGGAFYGCTALETILIGSDTITRAVTRSTTTATGTIGDEAFFGCTALTTICCEDITSIGISAFEGCTALKSFTANSVTTLLNFIFAGCTALESVEMTSVTYLSCDLFNNCTSLTTVNLPNVINIDSSSFNNCSSLESITMGNVRIIEACAFEGCDKLTSVTLANADDEKVLTSVDSSAFGYRENSIDLTLGEANRDLVSFGNCLTVNGVKFEFNSINIDGDYDVNPNSANLSDYSATIYPTDNDTWIVNTDADQSYEDFEGLKAALEADANKDKDITLQFPSLKTISDYDNFGASNTNPFFTQTAINSVEFDVLTEIYEKFFRGNTGLTSIKMDKVKTIRSNAFQVCTNLLSVSMSGVETIESAAFENCSSITEITANNLTSLDDNAFNNCSSLEKVEMIALTFILSNTFFNCTSLSSVNLPEVTTLYLTSFYQCTSLESVTMESVTELHIGAFNNCTNLTTINLPNVTKIDFEAFRDCTSLTTASLATADNVTLSYIDSEAFRSVTTTNIELTLGAANENLVYFGKMLTVDGNSFEFKNITVVGATLPTNSAYISNYSATAYPTDNTWIVKTDATQSYEDFEGLKAALNAAAAADANRKITLIFPDLKTITGDNNLPLKGITSIEEIQFTVMTDTDYAKSLINEIGNPISLVMDGVTSVGNGAFGGCTALTSVTMNSVTSVGNDAFRNCFALTSVTIDSVTSIGDNAFYSCERLTSVTMDSVTSIGDNAFFGCSELNKISFPKVTEIGNYAFHWCNKLVTASLATEANTKLESLGTNIFYDGSGGNNNEKIDLTLGAANKLLVDFGTTLTVGGNSYDFKSITVDGATLPTNSASLLSYSADTYPTDNTWIVNTDADQSYMDFEGLKAALEANANKDKDINLVFPYLETISDYSDGGFYVSSSVNNPFFTQTAINSVQFDELTEIYTYFFYENTGLTSITANKATKISRNSNFYGCSNLTTVKMEKVESLGYYTFYNCTKLVTLEMDNIGTIGDSAFNGCEALTFNGVNMENVTSIGSNAFSGCKALESITANSVTSLGTSAFTSCWKLETVEMNNVEAINQSTFSNCSYLLSVTMNSVTSISMYAFAGCNELTKLTIATNDGAKLTYIDTYSFSGISNGPAKVNLTLGAENVGFVDGTKLTVDENSLVFNSITVLPE